jgi:hypothetical protein
LRDKGKTFSQLSTLNYQLLLKIRLRLRQTDDFARLFPLAALLEQVDSFEPFQDIAPGRDGAGAFETAMLRHKLLRIKNSKMSREGSWPDGFFKCIANRRPNKARKRLCIALGVVAKPRDLDSPNES